MIIERLHLANFCQHEDLTLELTPGLNMLVGPNGAGKTNILRAIQLALIGDAGGERKKADDIRQGTPGNAEAFVEAWLIHYGARMHVRRALQGTTNLLTIDDARWTSVGEINSELWGRLGATKKQIADYIFVRQRKIDEMFDQPPAERAASLAALFGVAHAERVYEQLGKFVSAIEIPTSLLTEDELNDQAATHDEAIAGADANIAALELPEHPETELHANQTLIQQYNDERQAMARVEELQGRYTAKEAAAKAAAEPLRDLDAAIADLEAGLAAIAPDCADAEEARDQWKAHHAAAATRAALERDEATFKATWENTVAPVQPPEPRLSDEEAQQLKYLEDTCGNIRINLLDMGQADTCPTCGQKMPGANERAQRKAELEDELAAIQAQMPPLRLRRDTWDVYDRADSAYIVQMKHKASDQRQLEGRRLAIEACSPPETSEEEVQKTLNERSHFQEALQQVQAEKTSKALQLSSLEGECKQLAEALQQAQDAHNALQPWHTKAQHDEAQAANADILAKQRQLEQFTRERALAHAKRVAVQEQIENVRKTLAQGQKTREVVQHLTDVRSVFHRNEAPRMVSYTYVEMMLEQVNEALSMFEAPFRVEMDESLGFTARFLDGVRVQPDRRLSIGERIVLAMAFRITVNSTFAGQVGVLIMDEPTAGLDEHNLDSLPRALERLRDLSHERGLQVLFVTHEPRISHHFDNTIELPAA